MPTPSCICARYAGSRLDREADANLQQYLTECNFATTRDAQGALFFALAAYRGPEQTRFRRNRSRPAVDETALSPAPVAQRIGVRPQSLEIDHLDRFQQRLLAKPQ
ncbi:hypothetical protein [Paraburkholderia sp. 2C]